MPVDLFAGTRYQSNVTAAIPHDRDAARDRAPKILVFDSGLGGLTVFAEIVAARPDADYVYAADDAAFPYGRLGEAALLARVGAVMKELVAAYRPDLVVIACNTASTLVLPHLRAAFPGLPFVGTVPAVKPAATPFEIAPDLGAGDAGDGGARLYARPHRAAMPPIARSPSSARSASPVSPRPICRAWRSRMPKFAHEITPCFIESEGTPHRSYRARLHALPAARRRFERLAPWPVEWVDPAPAIAQRTCHVLAEQGFAPRPARPAEPGIAIFSSGTLPGAALAEALARRRLAVRQWPRR